MRNYGAAAAVHDFVERAIGFAATIAPFGS